MLLEHILVWLMKMIEYTNRCDDDKPTSPCRATNDGNNKTRCYGNAPSHKVSNPCFHPHVQETL